VILFLTPAFAGVREQYKGLLPWLLGRVWGHVGVDPALRKKRESRLEPHRHQRQRGDVLHEMAPHRPACGIFRGGCSPMIVGKHKASTPSRRLAPRRLNASPPHPIQLNCYACISAENYRCLDISGTPSLVAAQRELRVAALQCGKVRLDAHHDVTHVQRRPRGPPCDPEESYKCGCRCIALEMAEGEMPRV